MLYASITAGVRRAAVLALGVLPFGVVYGVAVADSEVGAVPGLLASVAIFAGASQLSLLELHDQGALWAVGVGTALVINARFVLYSAALAPSFSEFPPSWRHSLPHLMTDQAAALSLIEFETERDPLRRRGFYLGAALSLFTMWQLGTLLGVLAGAQIPESLQLGFIIPVMFMALVVPALADRAGVAAAITSAAVSVATAFLPAGSNILLGALAGIAVGAVLVDPARSELGESR